MHIEDDLAARAAYRRRLDYLHRWICPEGITLSVVCWPQEYRIDVILSAEGIEMIGQNATFISQEESSLVLDTLANHLMARVVAAYGSHELPDRSEVAVDLALQVADRTFRESLESIACKGKVRKS